ncbi:helix-turn-helix domain-containing protein [Stappia sp. ES.058]|uniref:helix-turn-helix domain-containing protein n=1 Tax=Stappia sp. ES.058 TaxID=1881061 RepID=UPI00087A9928|nr:helix-turn-helix transcriptional regulator [Stappia sp. ES.058]SDU41669.1 Transcriptional regulator, contains XRE-family HTH domain [Stappia sp. ES.058]
MQLDQDARLAERIRSLRNRQGWTLEELADRSSVSRATLSRIENAEVSPNTQVLAKLCSAYGLTLTRLLAPVDEGFQPLIAHEEQTTWTDGEAGYTRRVVSPPSRGLSAEVIRCELRADTRINYQTAPVPGQEHHLVMLEGTLEVGISGQNYRLSAGDCLRYRLVGASHFETRDAPAAYLLVLD